MSWYQAYIGASKQTNVFKPVFQSSLSWIPTIMLLQTQYNTEYFNNIMGVIIIKSVGTGVIVFFRSGGTLRDKIANALFQCFDLYSIRVAVICIRNKLTKPPAWAKYIRYLDCVFLDSPILIISTFIYYHTWNTFDGGNKFILACSTIVSFNLIVLASVSEDSMAVKSQYRNVGLNRPYVARVIMRAVDIFMRLTYIASVWSLLGLEGTANIVANLVWNVWWYKGIFDIYCLTFLLNHPITSSKTGNGRAKVASMVVKFILTVAVILLNRNSLQASGGAVWFIYLYPATTAFFIGLAFYNGNSDNGICNGDEYQSRTLLSCSTMEHVRQLLMFNYTPSKQEICNYYTYVNFDNPFHLARFLLYDKTGPKKLLYELDLAPMLRGMLSNHYDKAKIMRQDYWKAMLSYGKMPLIVTNKFLDLSKNQATAQTVTTNWRHEFEQFLQQFHQ